MQLQMHETTHQHAQARIKDPKPTSSLWDGSNDFQLCSNSLNGESVISLRRSFETGRIWFAFLFHPVSRTLTPFFQQSNTIQ
mmetsp:Transcript_23770/g.56128  ORF Transcript_23770/g.56128 Transcript_23770/m.56128 type:complete len:82 (-) Transcript_23770:164-409(-)